MIFKKLNKKGQAFESFRLLIGFILALAILSIILFMVQKTNQNSLVVSSQRLQEEIQSASKSAGVSSKIPYKIKDIKLKGNITTSKYLRKTDLNHECIYFHPGPGLEYLNNPRGDIKTVRDKSITMHITIYCNFDTSKIAGIEGGDALVTSGETGDTKGVREACPKYCLVYFNSSPPKEIYN